MTTTTPPSEHDIHAYVDGHLDSAHRSEVERYLARHPEQADEVQGWRNDAQQLRTLLAGDLTPAPGLDPITVRETARRRHSGRLALAASLFLCLAVGSMAGWTVRGIGTGDAPMADAMQAYRLLALDHGVGMDITTGNETDLRAWLAGRVGSDVRLPDLADAGFRPIGGRLFATEQGPAGMVLYDDGNGHTVSFYVRPPGPARRMLPRGSREENGLLANYWSNGGHNYAVVASANDGGRGAAERVVQRSI
ncbi:Transmembrane transcriptional regulator (anti-sigma factor RsiW) [Luteibacter sp. UNC138MFCol5.1]|uniref:anti-sigma factor family protein n=1 Tax=Luteibacter sp. UNC138MFCol5.1 TaxID=1502774 RepID=UPI0008CDE78A|nr:anti-sigma factor [Luteibacter sp. UNC138MFCol5.1]SEO73745.1 Transmembrane transcriptional regulator (anti-sigma factor RsiW) [Luteibacter sp. UNC138MFCol5.1]